MSEESKPVIMLPLGPYCTGCGLEFNLSSPFDGSWTHPSDEWVKNCPNKGKRYKYPNLQLAEES